MVRSFDGAATRFNSGRRLPRRYDPTAPHSPIPTPLSSSRGETPHQFQIDTWLNDSDARRSSSGCDRVHLYQATHRNLRVFLEDENVRSIRSSGRPRRSMQWCDKRGDDARGGPSNRTSHRPVIPAFMCAGTSDVCWRRYRADRSVIVVDYGSIDDLLPSSRLRLARPPHSSIRHESTAGRRRHGLGFANRSSSTPHRRETMATARCRSPSCRSSSIHSSRRSRLCEGNRFRDFHAFPRKCRRFGDSEMWH